MNDLLALLAGIVIGTIILLGATAVAVYLAHVLHPYLAAV